MFDCRRVLGLDIRDFGGAVSWRHAYLMVQELMKDPANHLAAAVAEWDYPASREYLATLDLYDLQHKSKAGKGKTPKPYPRPFKDVEKKRFGKTKLSPAQAIEVLAARSPLRVDPPPAQVQEDPLWLTKSPQPM